MYMYADSTKMAWVVNEKKDWKALQQDLRSLWEWSDKWQLKFNSTKCKVMHLGKSNRKYKYSMIGNATVNTLEETVEEKDLEVWTDNELKFVKHIEK